MNLFTGIIVYLLIFWTALFCVLPWGNQRDPNEKTGNMTGAPKVARIKEKFILTAVLSAVIWGIVFALIEFEVIDFYAIARSMIQEDFGS